MLQKKKVQDELLEHQEDNEMLKRISHIGLLGNTLGSEANRLLSTNSMSTLIVNGTDLLLIKPLNKDIIKKVTPGAILIPTNDIDSKYKVSKKYRQQYELWMDRAVSNLIEKIDNISYPTILFSNTNNLDNLFFDIGLRGQIKTGELFYKVVRVNLIPLFPDINNKIFKFIIDTVYHDQSDFLKRVN